MNRPLVFFTSFLFTFLLWSKHHLLNPPKKCKQVFKDHIVHFIFPRKIQRRHKYLDKKSQISGNKQSIMRYDTCHVEDSKIKDNRHILNFLETHYNWSRHCSKRLFSSKNPALDEITDSAD